jgi:ArsR family transcriptional regulator, arsenate/arsenite/antimonite-responsive transcriptional repressor
MTTAPADVAVPVRIRGCCQPLPAGRLQEGAAESVASIFKALADPTRVEMVHFLRAASGPICVCDFTAVFDLSQPTVSHHLGKLRDAGIVRVEKRGVWSFYQLRDDMLPQARAAVDAIA